MKYKIYLLALYTLLLASFILPSLILEYGPSFLIMERSGMKLITVDAFLLCTVITTTLAGYTAHVALKAYESK